MTKLNQESKMSNNSSKVREAIDTLSTYILELTRNYNENNSHSDLHQFLNEIQKELKRLQRAFETRRFFVVTIGALKAGKSTLINALTGYKVSPAGTGAETTKKCSIIMSADDEHQEGITLYRYKKTSSQELNGEERRVTCEKATRSLMDYLKGICDWNDEFCDFERKTYPLRGHGLDPANSMDNLEYILTSSDFSGLQQFRDYMLAEIRIRIAPDKRSVLSQNVAIIDMPGLDGTLAGVDSDDVNPAGNPVNFLPKFSHLFLLVQSSISGLNRTTASKLKEWQAGKKSTPVYLVFNIINSKSDWCNDQSIKQESEERQRRALAELKQQKVFFRDCYTVNAAKAWEACQRDEYEQCWKPGITEIGLRQASDIEVLIEALQKDFTEQTDRIIQEDAVNGVSNALRKFIERANALKDKASINRDTLNDERDIWEKIMQCLDDCNNEIKRDNIQSLLGSSWDKKLPEANKKASDAIAQGLQFPWLDDKKDNYAQVEQLALNVWDSLQKAHVEQGFIGALNDLMKSEFKNFYANLNSRLDDLKNDYPQYGACIDFVKGEIRHFSQWVDASSELQSQYSPRKLVDRIDKEELSGWISKPWFQRTLEKYGIKFIDKFQHDFLQELATTVKSKMSSYCITSDQHSSCLLNKRVNAVKTHLEETQEKKKEKLNVEIAQYDEIIKLIPELVEHINFLDDACVAFERALSV